MKNIIRKCDCISVGASMSINGVKYYVTKFVIANDKKSVTYTVDNFDYYGRTGQPRVRHIVKSVEQESPGVKVAA